TDVTLIEMLENILPIEDTDVSIMLDRIFTKRKIDVRAKTKTDKVEKTGDGVRLTLSGAKPGTIDADVVLVAVGVTGNTENLAGPDAKLEIVKNRVKVTPDYRTNLENVWAIGDCVMMEWPKDSPMAAYRHPDLAHVAHHEAVTLVNRICGQEDHTIDYK